jgi:hypothetical protein
VGEKGRRFVVESEYRKLVPCSKKRKAVVGSKKNY